MPPPSPEESTFLILKALNTFGFLEALLPASGKGRDTLTRTQRRKGRIEMR